MIHIMMGKAGSHYVFRLRVSTTLWQSEQVIFQAWSSVNVDNRNIFHEILRSSVVITLEPEARSMFSSQIWSKQLVAIQNEYALLSAAFRSLEELQVTLVLKIEFILREKLSIYIIQKLLSWWYV